MLGSLVQRRCYNSNPVQKYRFLDGKVRQFGGACKKNYSFKEIRSILRLLTSVQTDNRWLKS